MRGPARVPRSRKVDNSPSNTATLLTRYYGTNRITVLSHPLYSFDLASADYFLLSKLKIIVEAAKDDSRKRVL